MAVHKNSSEEDYLDSLLNAVLNNSNEKNQEELNNREELLGEIEDDLFDGDISSMEALGFDETSGNEASDSETAAEEKPRNKRKGLFGRKRKERKKSDVSPKQDDVFEASDVFENQSEFMEDLPDDNILEEALEENLTDSMSEEQKALADESSSFEEEDMKGLYDILGVNVTEETQDNDEISRLEEEKPKKRGKKEKKAKREKKKIGFGKRKSSKKIKDEATDDESDLDLHLDFSDDSVNERLSEGSSDEASEPEIPLNSGMEDMGLGGLEHIFIGGEEAESHEIYNEDMGTSEDYGRDHMSDDEEEPEDNKSKNKEKKEKKKKEKKKKEKKPKKEKKKKEKKKSEKSKDPDEIIHIPVPFIIFCISLIILLAVGLKLGGNYRYYKEKTDLALTYYLDKDFEAAYDELKGLDMNEKDMNFYNQVETIMFVQRHYTSYKSLYSLKMYDQALFTLLRGVKMYDKYKDTAREYNCYDDMTLVIGWIDSALQEKYGLTESEAREMNLMTDRYKYAEKIYELADKAEEREKALEEE